MSEQLNFKSYLIIAAIVCGIICVFSYKIAFGLALGTGYFFVSDILNRSKFPRLDSKSVAITKVFLISLIQFILIVGVALLSYYVGGLYALLISFVGITIPHIYFIIVELRKIKK